MEPLGKKDEVLIYEFNRFRVSKSLIISFHVKNIFVVLNV